MTEPTMAALLVAVPVLPALGALLVPLLRPRLAGAVAVVVSAAALLVALPLPLAAEDGPLWHRVGTDWAPRLGLRLDLAVDGLSYPLILLSALLALLCCLHTVFRPPRRDVTTLLALLLAVDAGVQGVFTAANLVLFFVCFEVVLLPMYAIIAVWGGERRRHAAVKFAVYTLLGSLLLLVGVFVLVTATGTAGLPELTALAGSGVPPAVQLTAFTLLALGFAVKSPLWPLHTWLPDAHTQAPTVGSVLLAGVLLKLGTYGFLRVAMPVLPDAAHRAAPVLGVLAVAAVLVGGLVCLAQTELKRLIAYSSVGHMGFVLLGVATLTPAGLSAAAFGNVAHGLITGLLFFLAGAVKDRAGTGELSRLGGLREVAPGLAGLLGFTALASLGLPGLAGFWGEAFAVYAALSHQDALWTVLAVLAAVGAALAAGYLLRMLRLVTHGPIGSALSPGPDGASIAGRLGRSEIALWTPLAFGILVFGLAPWLLLDSFAAPLLEWVGR